METEAKTFRGWLKGQINKASKEKNLEMFFLFRKILEVYNFYNPERKAMVVVDSWKGKSSFEIIKGFDKIIIVKYQKPSKYDEPKEIRTEVVKEEISAMIDSINKLSKDYEEIDSKYLAMEYSRRLGLGHTGWRTGNKPFFSDRGNHNKFTLILGALDKLGFIKYSGGKTRKIVNKIKIQEVLQ